MTRYATIVALSLVLSFGSAAAGLRDVVAARASRRSAPNSSARTRGTPVEESGWEIELALGASLRVADTGLTVSFEKVVDDSRCPTGVTCTWAGDAAVTIRIDVRKASASRYTLHTNLPSAREAEHRGVRIRLVALAPRPGVGRKPRSDKYRVTLLIERT